MSSEDKLNISKSNSWSEKVVGKLLNVVTAPISMFKALRSEHYHKEIYDKAYLQNQSVTVLENNELVYRRADCQDCLIDSIFGLYTIPELFKESCKIYAKRRFHGTRKILNESVIESPKGRSLIKLSLGEFMWDTYAEIYRKVESIGAFYDSLSMDCSEKMALFADTSSEWLCSLFALTMLNIQCVTVYSTLSDEAILHALNLTEVSYLFVDKKAMMRVMKLLPKLPTIKKIFVHTDFKQNDLQDIISKVENINMVSDHEEEESVDAQLSKGDSSKGQNCTINCYHMSHIIKKGYKLTLEKPFEMKQVDKNDIAMIMFTSGSTGTPKGVMIQHKNIVAAAAAGTYKPEIYKNKIYPAFLPAAHIFELVNEIAVMTTGASIGYCRSLTLTDNSPMVAKGTRGDLVVLKPEISPFVPLFLERIKSTIIDKVNEQGSVITALMQFAVDNKIENRRKGDVEETYIDKLFQKIRQTTGGKMIWGISGGAPLSSQTQEFISVALGIRLVQGYGLTETCATGFMGDINDLSIGNCGPPIPCVEIKLVPWEEGGYLPTDKPNPRGEIWIQGSSVTAGYYKQDDLTKESYIFDEEHGMRWFKTGDIGELLPNGTFKIIDRKKDIIKLVHGEYIALTQVEAAANLSKFIDLLCVAPNFHSTYIVLIAMPNHNAVRVAAKENNISSTDSINELLKNSFLKKLMETDVINCCGEAKLRKYEIPHKIIFVEDIWTPETGFLTPSMKVKRNVIKKFYKNLLN